MVEGTNESFLARKLSELKFSNSSGPCACIHLLLVSIVRSFTLQHVYTRKGTSKRFVVVHYQGSRCIYKFFKFSYFLTGGKDLESLAEDYFWPQTSRRGRWPTERLRFWQQRWKLIRKLTQMITLTFQIVIHLSDRKCRHLQPKHVDVHLEITEIHAALLEKLKSSSIAKTTLQNFPRLNSIW